jgi:LytR cell envelope-related transcriptional attenuator
VDLLKEIGAILGFVAFGGMAVLALLTFQQARHVRRLREWAGRSPERAAVEAERVSGAASEATIARSGGLSDEVEDEEAEKGPGRVHRLRGEAAYRWEEIDRRSPFDAKILIGGIVAILIGVAIVTGGFGLFGGSDDSSTPVSAEQSKGEAKPAKVAVLNGTAPEVGGVGVAGVAETAAGFVEDAGFKVDETTNGPPLPASVVMYDGSGAKADATKLADALEGSLGTTEVVAMTPEVKDVAGKASIALVVGADDSGI